MLDNFFRVTKFIPKQCVESFYDINFNKLYEEGKRYILCDVDNTLIPYDVFFADEKLKNTLEEIQKIGFKIIFVSNNRSETIGNFSKDLGIDFITSAKKPLKNGFKKGMKKLSCKNREEVVTIGDQLMTDVLGSNRMKLDCILVKPLKKSIQNLIEKWKSMH